MLSGRYSTFCFFSRFLGFFFFWFLNGELFAPESNLLEPVDVGAFLRCQIWHVKLLEQICKFVQNFLLCSLLIGAFSLSVKENKSGRARLFDWQSFNVHSRFSEASTAHVREKVPNLVHRVNKQRNSSVDTRNENSLRHHKFVIFVQFCNKVLLVFKQKDQFDKSDAIMTHNLIHLTLFRTNLLLFLFKI